MKILKSISICLLILTSIRSSSQTIIVGAERWSKYAPVWIKNKTKIGLVCNQTSTIGHTHLVDSFLKAQINITKIFSPEHGFRGKADAGEKVNSSKDDVSGLPIISLYGSHQKPTKEDLNDIDLLVFDIQDVGVRFYTFISTLQYVMEACADHNIPLVILDRPNPNGHYIDGPVLHPKFKSFVGMQAIPIVYGMTIGEYAKMLVGENWLSSTKKLTMNVISCQNYKHSMHYSLPVAPSPNLRSDQAIALYPSLCLFEGTGISVGRGTPYPFELYGCPYFLPNIYHQPFGPNPNEGAKDPLYKGMLCVGEDLRSVSVAPKIELSYLINAYHNWDKSYKIPFFNENLFFDKLAGDSTLRKSIQNNLSEAQIRQSWEKDLTKFKLIRKKYLLYTE